MEQTTIEKEYNYEKLSWLANKLEELGHELMMLELESYPRAWHQKEKLQCLIEFDHNSWYLGFAKFTKHGQEEILNFVVWSNGETDGPSTIIDGDTEKDFKKLPLYRSEELINSLNMWLK